MLMATINDLPIEILTHLSPDDLAACSVVSRLWHDIAVSDHFCASMIRRYFSNAVPIPDHNAMLYRRLSIPISYSTKWRTVHDNGIYWKLKESFRGRVTSLDHVCRLEIYGNFDNVLPGTYEILFRLKFSGNPSNMNFYVNFLVAPPSGRSTNELQCQLCHSIDTTNSNLRAAADTCDWFHLSIGYIVVKTSGSVTFSLFGGHSSWQGGLHFDYAWLRSASVLEASNAAIGKKLKTFYQIPGLRGLREVPDCRFSYVVHIIEDTMQDVEEDSGPSLVLRSDPTHAVPALFVRSIEYPDDITNSLAWMDKRLASFT